MALSNSGINWSREAAVQQFSLQSAVSGLQLTNAKDMRSKPQSGGAAKPRVEERAKRAQEPWVKDGVEEKP
jgi:hypothetical protein